MSDLFNDEGEKPKRQTKAKAAAKQEVLPPETGDAEGGVVALVEETRNDPVAVFTDAARYSDFYQKLKAEVAKHVPDLTTDKGRKAIASLAFRVTKSKTALDAAGKTLTEDARNMIAKVNASRKTMETELAELAKEVRKPLTDWEAAEEARHAANEAILADIRSAAVIAEDDTSATVEERGRRIYAIEFDADQWDAEALDEATALKAQTVHTLLSARQRLAKQEADAAELEQLRAAQRERDEREAAERAEREAAEQAQREAEEAAERKRAWARQMIDYIGQVGLGMIGGKSYPYVILIRELEEKIAVTTDEYGDMADDVEKARVTTLEALNKAMAEQVERDRIAAEEAGKQRIEDAKREAVEQAARDAKAEADRKREAELQAERDAAAAREAEAAAERERVRQANEAALQEERDRAAEAQRQLEAQQAAERKRIADERAAEEERQRKAKDKEHRKTVKTAMFEAIMEASELDGDDADTALVVKIVNALCAGDVPHTTVEF